MRTTRVPVTALQSTSVDIDGSTETHSRSAGRSANNVEAEVISTLVLAASLTWASVLAQVAGGCSSDWGSGVDAWDAWDAWDDWRGKRGRGTANPSAASGDGDVALGVSSLPLLLTPLSTLLRR
jgi:hypothetical protein